MWFNRGVPVLSLAVSAVVLFARAPVPKESITIWQRTDGPFFSQALLWEPASLTEENLRALYLRRAPAMRSRRAWLVWVFVDPGDAYRELRGKFATEGTYERWLGQYSAFGRKLFAMGELYGYRENVVLRFRNAVGTCTESVLAGTNFLRIEGGGIRFEILPTMARYPRS